MANQMLYYDEEEFTDDTGVETGPLRHIDIPHHNTPHHEMEESISDADRRRHVRLLRKKIPKLNRLTIRLELRRSSEAFQPINRVVQMCSEPEAVNRLQQLRNQHLYRKAYIDNIHQNFYDSDQLEKCRATELVLNTSETKLMMLYYIYLDRRMAMMAEELSIKREILRNS